MFDPGAEWVEAEQLVAVRASDGSIPDGCSPGAVYKQHSGMVFLDQDFAARAWVVGNIVTGERVDLDVPYCQEAFLVFDDYGMGCIASDDWDPILIKQVFKEQVWISAEGQLVLQEVHEDQKHFTGLSFINKV